MVDEKIPIPRLIEGLRDARVYDELTQNRLDILAATFEAGEEITQKERHVVRNIFADRIEEIQNTGAISFRSLTGPHELAPKGIISCEVKDFLGFGNMGPVYSVKVEGKPFALKMHSAKEIEETTRLHGKFGLAGILHDFESRDKPTMLSELGQKVLARKPKKEYGRTRRIVTVHDVGQDGDSVFLLMDLLAVDPIHTVNPADLGGDFMDVITWSVDCAVALAQLHVEERRLHLNIRPEAFIRKAVKGRERLPKFTFFHFPRKFPRREDSAGLKTEFVMVDHLDTSVDISDREPKGLGTVGSWLFLPPERIVELLKILREDYNSCVVRQQALEGPRTIRLKRTQMDDIWALGLTFYQFLSGGEAPFGRPTNLSEMVNGILLTRFDYSRIERRLRTLVASMLTKDPQKRFKRVMTGTPDKIRDRKVMAEAVLYKLEYIGIGEGE